MCFSCSISVGLQFFFTFSVTSNFNFVARVICNIASPPSYESLSHFGGYARLLHIKFATFSAHEANSTISCAYAVDRVGV